MVTIELTEEEQAQLNGLLLARILYWEETHSGKEMINAYENLLHKINKTKQVDD